MIMDIYFEVEVSEKRFITNFACESFYSGVHFNMLVKVCFLGEAEVTTFFGAYVGSFVCVDAQVVKKVVPFLELLAAFVAL